MPPNGRVMQRVVLGEEFVDEDLPILIVKALQLFIVFYGGHFAIGEEFE